MPKAAVGTDVLIVGAGPVGLFLANECARRGLRWRLVEKHASQSVHSKALAIFPRTLEILDMAGLVEPFLAVANRVTAIRFASRERTLARIPFAPANTIYPFLAMVPQDVTEGLLAQALVRRGGSVEYETMVVAATPHADCVDVTLQRGGTRETVRAAVVVGCDGAHSTVRQLLQFAFEGSTYHEHFMLADVQTNDTLPANELQLYPNRAGPMAIFPMGAMRRRIVAMVNVAEGEAPTLELVRRLLAVRGPADIEARALHWSSYFRIHHRRATRLRAGRVFLAGDAAHVHSPFGGQGMNTGLHDAWNLAWKLDWFLHGHAGESLLDSYEAERMPVIRGVMATTHALTRALGTPSRLAQVLRDGIIPALSHIAPFQHILVARLSGLAVRYHPSAIIRGSGERYFDDAMRGGVGVRDRFLLLLDVRAPAAAAQAARDLTVAHEALLELRSTSQRGLTLVRPDGHIACRSNDWISALTQTRDVLDLMAPSTPI